MNETMLLKARSNRMRALNLLPSRGISRRGERIGEASDTLRIEKIQSCGSMSSGLLETNHATEVRFSSKPANFAEFTIEGRETARRLFGCETLTASTDQDALASRQCWPRITFVRSTGDAASMAA